MGTKERGDDRRESIHETPAPPEGSLDWGLRILARIIARDAMRHQATPRSPTANRKALTPHDNKNVS
jgi:hypothetical protein